MTDHDQHVLSVAEIVHDAVAAGDAALMRDFEEARFRSQLAAAKANAAGLTDVCLAATSVLNALGAPGQPPGPGYGEAMLHLATVLDAVGFKSL